MDHLVNQLFVFEGNGKIKVVNGNYSDYKLNIEEEVVIPLETKKPIHEKNDVAEADTKKKISFAEKKEHESLEKEIDALEKEKQALIEKLSSGALETEELVNCSKRIKELTDAIDSKTLRWLELEEFD
jgi:ATP-binding cassette subfamily F protein uup